MRALYDSEADALRIDLVPDSRVEHDEDIEDGSYCTVAIAAGRPVGIELLAPAAHLDYLHKAARAYDLDVRGLEAAAGSALAAPDNAVLVELVSPT